MSGFVGWPTSERPDALCVASLVCFSLPPPTPTHPHPWMALLQDTAKYVGVVLLRDTQPGVPTKYVRLKRPGEEDPEPEAPADFEWDPTA